LFSFHRLLSSYTSILNVFFPGEKERKRAGEEKLSPVLCSTQRDTFFDFIVPE
jgi:hypothetical protein